MAVSHLRNTPITGKSYTTPVDATGTGGRARGRGGGERGEEGDGPMYGSGCQAETATVNATAVRARVSK